MKSAGFKQKLNRRDIKSLIDKKLTVSNLKNAYIRVAVKGQDNKKPEIEIILKPVKGYPAHCYRRGVSVRTAVNKKNYINSLSPKIKSSNFLYGVCAKAESKDAFEVILLNHKGYVAEGSISNIFMVKSGQLFTPACFIGCLEGVTRKFVMQLGLKLKIKTHETVLTRHDFYSAEECFLTNTTMEVMPVVKIDNRKIGGGTVGKITKKLMVKFKQEVTR